MTEGQFRAKGGQKRIILARANERVRTWGGLKNRHQAVRRWHRGGGEGWYKGMAIHLIRSRGDLRNIQRGVVF